MLYDLDYANPADPKPLFFRPELKNGVIRIPDLNNSEEVRG
jgi:CRISPR-associated protein Cas5d